MSDGTVMVTDSSAPVQKTVLVKKIKVLVKRPVAPAPAAPAMIKVPVKRPVLIKVPVKRPVAPISAPAVRPPAKPVAPASSAASAPAGPTRRFARGREIKPLIYEVPDDIIDRIDARKKIPEKLFLLYIFARTLAESNAERDGYKFPPMLIDLPKDTLEATELLESVDEDIYDALLSDLDELAPFIPGMERVMHSKMSVEDLIDREVSRASQQDVLTSAQQIVLAFLLVLSDMKMVRQKLALHEIDKEQQDIVDGIRSMEEEEKAMKHDFIVAIQRKGFPVNATKLINNYFTLAKKDPEKAYQTLITNPLYFSPIQMDRLPKKFFGLISAGPKEARAVNKRLASFLKNLKV